MYIWRYTYKKKNTINTYTNNNKVHTCIYICIYIYIYIYARPPTGPIFFSSRGNVYDLKTCSRCVYVVYSYSCSSGTDTVIGIYNKYILVEEGSSIEHLHQFWIRIEWNRYWGRREAPERIYISFEHELNKERVLGGREVLERISSISNRKWTWNRYWWRLSSWWAFDQFQIGIEWGISSGGVVVGQRGFTLV